MRRLWRQLPLTAAAGAVAALALATPASAAITTTTITTPGTSPVYSTFNADTPNTFAIAGTTDSTVPATDKVDLRCFYGSPATSVLVQAGVSLAAGGSFSVPAANLGLISPRECRLRAVPAGSTANSNVYRGPLMLTDYVSTAKIVGGPNAGTAYNFYLYGQQLGAADDFVSLGAGGFWDSYLFDDAYGRDTTVFFANAYLWKGDMDGVGDVRSEVQVDTQNAYPSSSAYFLFGRSAACPPTCNGSQDNAGFPPVTYTFAQDPTNGNVTIHESENLVRCPTGVAYPPTHATCGAFTATGVKVDRTIVQNHSGHVVFVTDAFSSTDGAQHSIDLLYENAQFLNASKQPNIGYQLAGQSAYAAHAAGETATVPSRPGSIYVKNLTADDGDPTTGQGSITYSVAPTQLRFLSTAASVVSDFTMHYAGTVPASGALSYVFGYATEFTTAAVVADSLEILHGFTPCKVPKLKGKTLSQAKAALKTAYCALGTVKKAYSKTVKKGRVISSKPAAGVTKPWGTLVNLKMSKGKR